MAAEWNLYGSARMATFWEDFDAEDLEDAGLASDRDGLVHALQGNSRIGANVKVNDQIGGRFEFGVGTAVSNRLIYGTYNFGGGQLLVGQDYTPGSFFYSNSVWDGDGDLLGVGQFYGHRYGQIKLKMAGFSVALVAPVRPVSLGGTTNSNLPKIEAAYSFKGDAFFMDVFGGYQTYEIEFADGSEEDVNGWVIGVGGGTNLGPVRLAAGISYGQNVPAYQPVIAAGRTALSSAVAGPLLSDDGEIEDGNTLQGLLVATFKVSDAIALEAGIGYARHENDIDSDSEVDEMQYYLNGVVTIAPGFFVVPEVGQLRTRISNGDDFDAGTTTYVGLKWQINF
jgi:hypothetical protein